MKIQNYQKESNMSILNLPEFEVIDTIQDELIKNIEKAGRGYSFEVLRAKVLFGTSATKKPKYKIFM